MCWFAGNAISDEHGLSFGTLRELAIETGVSGVKDDSVLSMGCSSNLFARELSSTSCAADQIYCWHRCMGYSNESSPEICAEQGLMFNCTSQQNQIWLPDMGHGDYNPACTDGSGGLVSLSPTITPASDDCTGWNDFSEWGDYSAVYPLVHERCISWYPYTCTSSDAGFLLWNVVGDELEAKIVHNGRLGWIALGVENPGGAHEGMNVSAFRCIPAVASRCFA
jgi:hypothetical protein